MFRLRKPQIEAIEKAAEPLFVDRVMVHLRQNHAEAVAGLHEPVLRKRTAAGVARARRHGLERQDSVGTFVALMFEVAPDFDRHPVIAKILKKEGVAPDDRVTLLAVETTGEDWVEARRASDPAAWEET